MSMKAVLVARGVRPRRALHRVRDRRPRRRGGARGHAADGLDGRHAQADEARLKMGWRSRTSEAARTPPHAVDMGMMMRRISCWDGWRAGDGPARGHWTLSISLDLDVDLAPRPLIPRYSARSHRAAQRGDRMPLNCGIKISSAPRHTLYFRSSNCSSSSFPANMRRCCSSGMPHASRICSLRL